MLEQELKDFIDLIVLDYKDISARIGNLSALPAGIDKTSLVAALISLNSKIAAAAGISDTATGTGTTWSSSKISTMISAAVTALVNGAPTTLDTLKELSDQMTADKSVLDTVVLALGNRVRVDAVQSFTQTQKDQACDNIGAVKAAQLGNPSFDFAAYYTTKKAS